MLPVRKPELIKAIEEVDAQLAAFGDRGVVEMHEVNVLRELRAHKARLVEQADKRWGSTGTADVTGPAFA